MTQILISQLETQHLWCGDATYLVCNLEGSE